MGAVEDLGVAGGLVLEGFLWLGVLVVGGFSGGERWGGRYLGHWLGRGGSWKYFFFQGNGGCGSMDFVVDCGETEGCG